MNPKKVEAFAKQAGIPCTLLAPRLADYAATHQVALHGFFNTGFNQGHWNEIAHQLAGEEIARDMIEFDKNLRQPQVFSGYPPVSTQ